uniref:CCHC-type domain-containing protein n=1 Tax=Anopheles atroparvus TaxID=41427 RepID=A0AAG5DUT6_ANOAO
VSPGLGRECYGAKQGQTDPNNLLHGIEKPNCARRRTRKKRKRKKKGKAGHPGKGVQPAEQAPAKEKPSPKATEEKNDGFTVVGKKGKPAKPKPAAPKKRKEPRPKTRPDALLLKVQKGSSYAAVLKTLKTKREELKEIGEAAAKVRRSGDNVLFELTSAGSQGIGQLVESLQTELGGTATVATLRQTSIVVIRDVCEEVDRAEIRDDLMDQLQVQVGGKEIRLGAVVRGMRKAYITVNNDVALMMYGLKRIWWSSCRITVQQTERKCFRCHRQGHLAKNCKGPDRSALCFWCGSEEHKSAQCNGVRRCLDCGEAFGANHATGNAKCPSKRQAPSLPKK